MSQIIVDITAVRRGVEFGTWHNTANRMSYGCFDYFFSVVPSTSATFAEVEKYSSQSVFGEHIGEINVMLDVGVHTDSAHAVTLWREFEEHKIDWHSGTTDINSAIELIGKIDVQELDATGK